MAKSIILLLIAAVTAHSAELKLNENFVIALHQVETSGRYGAIVGDNGKALGPLQLHFAYWRDATEFDKTIGGTYKECADWNYSCRIVTAYLSRYAADAIRANDFKTLARIHNGGPNGLNKPQTKIYWRKVEKEMVRLNNK